MQESAAGLPNFWPEKNTTAILNRFTDEDVIKADNSFDKFQAIFSDTLKLKAVSFNNQRYDVKRYEVASIEGKNPIFRMKLQSSPIDKVEKPILVKLTTKEIARNEGVVSKITEALNIPNYHV